MNHHELLINDRKSKKTTKDQRMRTPLLPSSAHLQGIWNIIPSFWKFWNHVEPLPIPNLNIRISTILKQRRTKQPSPPIESYRINMNPATCRCSRLVFPYRFGQVAVDDHSDRHRAFGSSAPRRNTWDRAIEFTAKRSRVVHGWRMGEIS